MKKLTTYYFILLGVLNLWFASYLTFVTSEFKDQLFHLQNGRPIPVPTEQLLNCYWWPWVFFAVAGLGTLLSIAVRPDNPLPRRILTNVLGLELVGLVFTVVAFSMPWIRINSSCGH